MGDLGRKPSFCPLHCTAEAAANAAAFLDHIHLFPSVPTATAPLPFPPPVPPLAPFLKSLPPMSSPQDKSTTGRGGSTSDFILGLLVNRLQNPFETGTRTNLHRTDRAKGVLTSFSHAQLKTPKMDGMANGSSSLPCPPCSGGIGPSPFLDRWHSIIPPAAVAAALAAAAAERERVRNTCASGAAGGVGVGSSSKGREGRRGRSRRPLSRSRSRRRFLAQFMNLRPVPLVVVIDTFNTEIHRMPLLAQIKRCCFAIEKTSWFAPRS